MSWTGGDWLCGACQHANFKKREACQKCGYPKFGGVDVSTYLYNRTEVLAGDWYCGALNCGSHNYASRTSCYRCGMIKVEYTDQYYGAQMVAYGNDAGACPPGWKTGDWVCPRVGCGVHNYASRVECFKCKTTRDYGASNFSFSIRIKRSIILNKTEILSSKKINYNFIYIYFNF
ncbi:unnamed protein product [Brassica napus]|uniref:(rape) hypothetical protein n=1 Tax=Brassica napus TaxID=3708 RepID=A0A816YQ29_BRANA|nr:unnamed protein product [Brassica napus]